LPDGPAAQARNAKVATVPEDFGWIHAYDVQQALQASGAAAAAGSGTRQQSWQEAR
jgi:salicylate hydroxylase